MRAALALGAPPGLAEQVAADAADRVRGSWRRLRGRGGLDAEVIALVVEAWDDVRRTPWWRAPRLAADPDLTALDAVPPGERAALVADRLASVALDRGSSSPVDPLGEAGWAALRAVPVTSTPPDAARSQQVRRERRGRTARSLAPRLVALVAVAAVVAVVVAVGWRAARPDGPDPLALPAAPVREAPADAPTWLTWWADGALHLDDVVLDVPGVVQVVRGPDDSALYVDGTGAVAVARPDGTRGVVGYTDVPTSLVASDDGSRVAWSDSRRGLASLTSAGLRTTAPPAGAGAGGSVPVAVSDDLVWVASTQRTWVWRPGSEDGADELGDPERVVVDVGGDRAVVRGADGALAVVAVDDDGATDPGAGLPLVGRVAVLSGDGATAVSVDDGGVARVVDVASGEERPSGVGDELVVLGATLGGDGQVGYVVTRSDERPASRDFLRSSDTGPVTVLACERGASITMCASVATLSGTLSAPVLAR